MKVIRDPIHNIIQFDKDTEKVLLDLIDTFEFQRLRHIKQLGLSVFTYPGAEHSRFVHSLGVAHLVKRFIERICSLKGEQYKKYIDEIKEYRLHILIAALLHDIGHGPFSHALEKITGIEHEKWTVAIIMGDTEINSVLHKYGKDPREIADLIRRTHKSVASVKLLSSQLDTDRIDYLLRDARMTGAGYGAFDIEWLINTLRIGKVHGHVEIGLDRAKGLSIAEDFIMARYYMYINVYFHKTTRSAECLIRNIFNRALELQSDNKIALLPDDLNEILKKELTKEMIPHYLNLTDNTMWHHFYLWRNHNDSMLKEFTNRLLTRDFFKAIDLNDNDDLFTLVSEINHLSQHTGKSYEYYFIHDNPSNSFYKDTYISYSPGSKEEKEKEASEQIFLFDAKGNGEELSGISEIVARVRNKNFSAKRLFCPKEFRDDLMRRLRT